MDTLAGKLRLALAAVGLGLLGWGLWPLPRHTYTNDLAGARLTFTVPTALRLGDAPPAQLEVAPLKAAPAETAAPAPLQLTVRLTLDGARAAPQGEARLTLGKAAPVRLVWRVHPQAPGSVLGSLWVYQVFPDGSRMARLTYPLHLRVLAFLGLNGPQARLLGAFALLVAAVLAFAARQ